MQTGLLKVKTDIFQGSYSYRPRTRLPAMAEFYLEIFMFRPYNVLTLCLWVYKATTQTLAELSGLVCGPFFAHKVNLKIRLALLNDS